MNRLIPILVLLVAVGSLFSAAGCDDELKDRCKMEPDVGPCESYIPSYYYDSDSGECDIFYWGGCDGKVPFDTMAECEDACL